VVRVCSPIASRHPHHVTYVIPISKGTGSPLLGLRFFYVGGLGWVVENCGCIAGCAHPPSKNPCLVSRMQAYIACLLVVTFYKLRTDGVLRRSLARRRIACVAYKSNLITFNTNIPHLGVRLGAMLASVVALYNMAGLTSPALFREDTVEATVFG
jgi:hypothetical protein